MDALNAQKPAHDSLSVEFVHELSNQLTIVLGSLERLHRQPLNDAAHLHLEQAQLAACHAGRLLHRCIGTAETESDFMGDITTD